MKKFVLVLVCLIFLTSTKEALSQSNWVIRNFDSSIQIENSGVVDVTETISVDFRSLSKHGIFRELPYVYTNSDNSKTYLEFTVKQVIRNENPEKYSVSTADGYITIQIGDPDKTISGPQTYKIAYKVVGVLQGFDQFDELYWNVTGNYWEVPIEQVAASVALPKPGLKQQFCYQGVVGSTETCLAKAESTQAATFSSTRSLSANEGLTVAVGFDKNLVPLLVGQKPKSIWDLATTPVSLGSGVAVLVLGIGFVVSLWFKKGRDSWFGRNYLFTKQEQTKPVSETETIVVEYSPPENLRPAELAAILDEKVETLDVTATLVDLANRGFLTIKEEPKKWLFGSTDFVFTRLRKDTKGLREYEEELIVRLFDDGEETRLSELKNKFYKDLAKVKEKLYQNLVDRKFFQQNPNSVRVNYSLVAIAVGIIAGGLVWLGVTTLVGLLFTIGIAGVIVAIMLLIFAQSMPSRTAYGRQIYARSQGYRLFIDKAEKHRQQFFERKNLFNEVLPYAIAFGLTEKFAKAFEKMGLEAQQPSWYSGSRAFNTAAFAASMNSFSRSAGSSMASAPSSSGSGGGGSSGGGFGGGGGGSW